MRGFSELGSPQKQGDPSGMHSWRQSWLQECQGGAGGGGQREDSEKPVVTKQPLPSGHGEFWPQYQGDLCALKRLIVPASVHSGGFHMRPYLPGTPV